jgi:hypothetical protein
MDDLKLNIDLSKLPWLDNFTRIFQPGEPSRRLAWIPQDPCQWHRYAEGYREAAERVYASWGALSDDCLIFPLVFLYRHYVELRIKELLQSAILHLDLPIDWKRSHDIASLWRVLSPLLRQAFPDEPELDLRNAERLIQELAARDSLASEFRYPETKEGKRNLEDLERIDVVCFIDAMRKLAAFLDGASVALSVCTENKQHL